MSAAGITRPGELGELASEAIGELIARATAGKPVSTYAEAESPMPWSTIAEGGWDLVGVEEDYAVPLRDLAEIARVWGRACIQLPLIASIIAKRHSAAAREFEGPVTFSMPSRTSGDFGVVPYGQHAGIAVARGLGVQSEELLEGAPVEPENFDHLLRATRLPWLTAMSPEVAREIAVLLAAESSGAAARMLDDGVAFAKERHQFGKPIGSFQAVKHHLANALIHAEQAETAVIWSSLHSAEAYRGALFAVDHAITVGELILQVHGGMGFTWELGLHFLLRRMVSTRDAITGLEETYG